MQTNNKLNLFDWLSASGELGPSQQRIQKQQNQSNTLQSNVTAKMSLRPSANPEVNKSNTADGLWWVSKTTDSVLRDQQWQVLPLLRQARSDP